MAWALSLWAAYLAWTDWRQHRIPNLALVLVLVPALMALAINQQGLLHVSIRDSLFGFVIAMGVLLPGYVLGLMGAGDVKFAAVIGLLLGWVPTLRMLIVFGLAIGAMSLAALWWYRHQADPRKRRIAAAPALTLGFMSQLFVNELLGLL